MIEMALKSGVVAFGAMSALCWYRSAYRLPEQVKNREQIYSWYGKAAAIFAFLVVAAQAALNFIN
ncbi:MAG: hypothetical protein AAFR98_12130 [Pseudomonadota bacterium]